MLKTMMFRHVAGIAVVVHTADEPSETDWRAYYDFCMDLPKGCDRYLVRSKGGGPNAKQRKETNDILKARGTPNSTVAVVTDDVIGRGIVTALSWFNPKIRAFAPPELNLALKYLGLTPVESAQVTMEIHKMQTELES